MSRGRKAVVIGGCVAAVAGAFALIVFGVIGIRQTVSAGTQPTVCGVTVGVTSDGQTVRLLGASQRDQAPGDRVRLSPLCVVEVIAIENDASATGGEKDDGAGARVQLVWRLW